MKNASSQKYKSIHLNLLYHYVFAIMIVLTLIGVAFYWEAAKVIDKADYQFVADELNNMQFILANAPIDQRLLKESVIDNPVNTHDSLYRYYVRVMDSQNKLMIETPGMTDVLPLPKKSDQNFILGQHKKYFLNARDGNQFLMLQAPVTLPDGQGMGLVQIVLDTTYQHSITHDKRIFFIILFFGAALSLFMGVLITRRGLRSLNALTDTVKNITTSSLSKRVDSNALPSELMGLGQAFNEMLDRIESSFSRLKQMSADMSHELRTPIMNLIGQTEILLSYAHSETDYQSAHASNLEELQRMASIVENIMFLARAENPKFELTKQLVHVGEEVKNICEYYQAVADEKQIVLSCVGEASVEADPVMLRRLMSNIISNALKYTLEEGAVYIAVSEDSTHVVVSVEDTGIGIDQGDIPKLFDRFFRVDASRSAISKGSGLGLAIAKSIVDMHHGDICVISKKEIGTKVTISLPKG